MGSIMNKPRIGDKVQIQHVVRVGKGGLAYFAQARSFGESTITQLYGSGRVQVSSGDIWRIRQHKGKWVTTSII